MIAKKFFKKGINLKTIFSFVGELYSTGKINEFNSFLYWEIKYKLGLYKNKYINIFNTNESVFVNNIDSVNIGENSILNKSPIEWQMLFTTEDGTIYGSLCDKPNTLYVYRDNSLEEIYCFTDRIKGIYVSKASMIFICSSGKIYKSDQNLQFEMVLELTLNKSYFWPNNGFTENNSGTLFIGEYVVDWTNNKCHFGAYLYYSEDQGETWMRSDFLKRIGVNKHVHIVKWSKLLNSLILADGDNKKKLWINKSKNYDKIAKSPLDGWVDLTGRHINKGGYTAMVETDKEIIFGSDYLGGTNFIIKTSDMLNFEYQVIPDPYRRGLFRNMVTTNYKGKFLIWANSYSAYGKKTKSLIMVSSDAGNSWGKVIEYDGTKIDIIILNNSGSSLKELYLEIRNKKRESLITTINIEHFAESCKIGDNSR